MKLQAGAQAAEEEESEEPAIRSSGGGAEAGDLDFLEGVEQAPEGDDFPETAEEGAPVEGEAIPAEGEMPEGEMPEAEDAAPAE